MTNEVLRKIANTCADLSHININNCSVRLCIFISLFKFWIWLLNYWLFFHIKEHIRWWTYTNSLSLSFKVFRCIQLFKHQQFDTSRTGSELQSNKNPWSILLYQLKWRWFRFYCQRLSKIRTNRSRRVRSDHWSDRS